MGLRKNPAVLRLRKPELVRRREGLNVRLFKSGGLASSLP